MTKKEIIDTIENGGKLKVWHLTKSVSYYILDKNSQSKRITERQYYAAKDYFQSRLQHDAVYGGFTTHFYFLKH